jgi:hypothetical protein
MKQHALLFVAALALAAGCEKSSDVAPVAAEANGIIKSYQPRIAELQQRVDDLERARCCSWRLRHRTRRSPRPR